MLRLAIPLLLAPAAAWPQAECRFTTECVEDEPCAAADYAAWLSLPGDGMTGPAAFSDDSGTLEMTSRALASGTAHLGAGSGRGAYRDGTSMILTTAEDGAARLTVHFTEGPMAITYLGRCEAAS